MRCARWSAGLWGAVEGLPCIYGCRPEGGYLSDAEGYWLISESKRIGGGQSGPPLSLEEISDIMTREHIRAELDRLNDRGRRGDRLRADESVPAAFRRRDP